MKSRTAFAMVAALALLAACGRHEGRGGLTADEERQLDNAAAMLDDNTIDASPDSLTTNEQQLNAMDEADVAGGNSDDAE